MYWHSMPFAWWKMELRLGTCSHIEPLMTTFLFCCERKLPMQLFILFFCQRVCYCHSLQVRQSIFFIWSFLFVNIYWRKAWIARRYFYRLQVVRAYVPSSHSNRDLHEKRTIFMVHKKAHINRCRLSNHHRTSLHSTINMNYERKLLSHVMLAKKKSRKSENAKRKG